MIVATIADIAIIKSIAIMTIKTFCPVRFPDFVWFSFDIWVSPFQICFFVTRHGFYNRIIIMLYAAFSIRARSALLFKLYLNNGEV